MVPRVLLRFLSNHNQKHTEIAKGYHMGHLRRTVLCCATLCVLLAVTVSRSYTATESAAALRHRAAVTLSGLPKRPCRDCRPREPLRLYPTPSYMACPDRAVPPHLGRLAILEHSCVTETGAAPGWVPGGDGSASHVRRRASDSCGLRDDAELSSDSPSNNTLLSWSHHWTSSALITHLYITSYA